VPLKFAFREFQTLMKMRYLEIPAGRSSAKASIFGESWLWRAAIISKITGIDRRWRKKNSLKCVAGS